MIIQTGMRTDIPAFYSEWFLNRIKEGYVLVRNPYNPSQVTRYSLLPNVVDLIAFCTKNPAPMLSHMDALEPYGQYWFVTITPYGRDVEPNVPDKEKVMVLGVDIGAYDTCGHLCKYCYANTNADLVKENMRKHDPESPFLLGGNMPGDVIHEAKQKSWIDGQMRLEI